MTDRGDTRPRNIFHERISRRRMLALGAAAGVAALEFPSRARAANSATITVSGTQWGVSTAYIGATEGNVRFDIGDMQDLGINTYRIYGGMSRWESQDDDGAYGTPAIANIKANPNLVNWAWWDTAMQNPPGGSDYAWSGSSGLWQGSAATIFGALKSAGIKAVLDIRNHDNYGNPKWAPNPPTTTADWNEWWEHVFATVYWLNVRNDYRVDDFQALNEPNSSQQGWGGSEQQYFQMVQYMRDAIAFVYKTYLPGRLPTLHAPVTSSGSTWPLDALQQIPGSFNVVDIHNFNTSVTNYDEQVNGWISSTGHSNYPLWVSEWGTYRGGYQNTKTGTFTLIANLIRGSQAGQDYVTGSHLFSLYDWNGFGSVSQNFQGLIDGSGNRRASYYGFRMGIRALIGARPTYQSTSSTTDILAITTKDSAGHVYLLIANISKSTYNVTADVSQLLTQGTGTMWRFDSTYLDTVVASPTLVNGKLSFSIPSWGSVLVKF
jgi:hypothetical protein